MLCIKFKDGMPVFTAQDIANIIPPSGGGNTDATHSWRQPITGGDNTARKSSQAKS